MKLTKNTPFVRSKSFTVISASLSALSTAAQALGNSRFISIKFEPSSDCFRTAFCPRLRFKATKEVPPVDGASDKKSKASLKTSSSRLSSTGTRIQLLSVFLIK